MSKSTPVTHEDLGRGIDQFHPENRIPDGYWSDILNGDATAEGTVRKRTGYMRYGGSIPIRVTQIEHSGTTIDLTVDASFDLTDLRPTPILVYGRLSATQSGDFDVADALVYYSTFSISSGKIRLTDVGAVSATYTDSEPQLSIWGIDWSTDIRASDAEDRWGWINHISTYRTSTDSYPVAGLGGNLFAARTRADAGADYGMPRVYPLIRGVADGAQVVGPAFHATGATPARTRGFITATGASTHYVDVVAAAYDSVSGYVDFSLSVPGYVASTTLSNIVEVDVDYLTVSGVASGLDGTWLIRAVSYASEVLTVRCDVTGVSDSRYNVSGHDGQAGIFSDVLLLTATSTFSEGDAVASTAFDADSDLEVHASSGLDVILGGFDEMYSVGGSEVIYGTRTSAVLVPRDSGGTATTANLVRGDMLEVTQAGTELGRRVCIVNLNLAADRTVSISGDGETATLSITSGTNTAALAVGDVLRLRSAGVYNGDITLVTVPTTTTATFESTETASVTGATLVGGSVGLDESIELADSSGSTSYVEVHARWIPLEWPEPASAYVPQTRTVHYDQEDYDDRSFLASAMSQDNLYLCDGVHPVMRYDGTNISYAGLPRWQSSGFLRVSSGRAVRDVLPSAGSAVTVASTAGSTTYECTLGDETSFSKGDVVVLEEEAAASGPGYYSNLVVTMVTNTYDDATDGFIELARSAGTSATGLFLYPISRYNYYYRHNLVDANNNIVASAQTSSRDLGTVIGGPAQIHPAGIPFPRLGGYDFSRMDLQLYRTAESGTPPFFRLASTPVEMGNGRGYSAYADSTAPSLFIDESGSVLGSLDEVASALVGAELGTAWDRPPIGSVLASASNRLLVGNVTDYEQLDIHFRKSGSSSERVEIEDIDSTTLILRKDGATGSTTNMSDTLVFELVGSGSVRYESDCRGTWQTVLVAADGSSFTLRGVDDGTTSITETAGNWIYIYERGGGPRQGAILGESQLVGYWQVSSASAGIITCRSNLRAPLAFTHTDVNKTDDLITITGHGLVTGDVVTLGYTATPLVGSGIAFSGNYVIRVDEDTLQLASSLANAQAGTEIDITATGTGPFQLIHGPARFDMFLTLCPTDGNIPVLIFDTVDASTDPADVGVEELGDSNFSRRADHDLSVAARDLQFPLKLANAINSVMSNFDAVQYPNFRPWVSAHAGNDFGPRELVLRRLDVAATAMTIEHDLPSPSAVYVNGALLATATRASATRRVFPSRLCRSYPNYPEIFDAPYTQLDSDSDSAIDVEPSNGQELVGVAPFFGDSAFGNAQKEQLVLAFKEYSVYLVDVETKRVQKLETNGQGCTYPRSIEQTKHGVMFANEAGLWKINRSLECVYMGEYLKRAWRGRVNHDGDSDIPCATHSQLENKYKVSVPIGSDAENSEVYVYDHTRESGDSRGAWTRYDSHPATAWSNFDSDSLFGTTTGTVMSVRREGDASDYRDDAAAIQLLATYKATNFGLHGVRKFVHAVSVGFRLVADMAGTTVRAATELLDSFSDLDIFTALDAVNLDAREVSSNLVDLERAPIRTPQFGLPTKRAEYVQIQIENSTKDEACEVVDVTYHVSPGTRAGTDDAADS